jgi:uncharacterized protein (DUF1800 family)
MESADVRHLLRRLAFAATPEAERTVGRMSVSAAFDSMLGAARNAAAPEPPDVARPVWTNTALRLVGMSTAQYRARYAAQVEVSLREIERLRQWWLREMIAGPAPLRENLVLFFHGTLGSSSGSVDMPQALHACNALIRRSCLGTIPSLLEQLVTDPAMMIQIGMDEHRRDPKDQKLSDRPAKLILDNWTVGAGEYSEADVAGLSRALTGWVTVAPPGHEPTEQVDPTTFRSARRVGLVPIFESAHFEKGPKTILGTTSDFDARSAMRFLARHPATARRFSRRLIAHLGVEDPNRRLEEQLVETYRTTDGSIEALLRAIVVSDAFWASDSRWQLIKSPVHLAVGACRQLGLTDPPLAEISQWLTATGQRLFDTPDFGDSSWTGQDAWVTPPDRLAVRYQLASVLAGRMPQLGVEAAAAGASSSPRLVLPGSLRSASLRALIARLDPAPGLEPSAIERRISTVASDVRAGEAARQIVATPQYQLA